MKRTMTVADFISHFQALGRGGQFTIEALVAIYDYFTELEISTGSEIKSDPIAICCEWTEYEDMDEFREDYGNDYEDIEDVEKWTTVLRLSGDGFVMIAF